MLIFFFQAKAQTKMGKMGHYFCFRYQSSFWFDKGHDFVDMFFCFCFEGETSNGNDVSHGFGLLHVRQIKRKQHTAFRSRSFFCFRQVVGVKSYVSFGKVTRIFIRSHDMSHFLPG